MLADDRFVLRQVNAERLVRRDERFEPLNIRPQLPQRLIRRACRLLQLFPFQGSHLRNIPLDDVFLHLLSPCMTAWIHNARRIGGRAGCDKMADMPSCMGI